MPTDPLHEASDPTTAPARLAALFQERWEQDAVWCKDSFWSPSQAPVLGALVANPSLPEANLRQAMTSPSPLLVVALANPSAAFLVLEDPSILTKANDYLYVFLVDLEEATPTRLLLVTLGAYVKAHPERLSARGKGWLKSLLDPEKGEEIRNKCRHEEAVRQVWYRLALHYDPRFTLAGMLRMVEAVGAFRRAQKFEPCSFDELAEVAPKAIENLGLTPTEPSS